MFSPNRHFGLRIKKEKNKTKKQEAMTELSQGFVAVLVRRGRAALWFFFSPKNDKFNYNYIIKTKTWLSFLRKKDEILSKNQLTGGTMYIKKKPTISHGHNN